MNYNTLSRETLYNLLERVRFEDVFFDVNLRMNYYSPDIIKQGLKYATILKVNFDECIYMCKNGICSSPIPERDIAESA